MNSEEYLYKVYSGLLGKIIGVRLGAAVEPTYWTYEKIREAYGEIDNYVKNYINFAADDDINGPLYFIRAVEDFRPDRLIKSENVGDTWLNYTSEGNGMFWWGGYGISTEHTAYLSLKSGIKAPLSGSIEKNGYEIAEQIGGQIFIDTWGLISPGDPETASENAAAAAAVSHDGEGVYGAGFIAAAIAIAFEEKNTEIIIEKSLNYIPKDSEYYAMVKDITAKYHENPDNWRTTCEYILEKYGDKNKYPGIVHIIPNSAVIIMALLYGKGDFSETVKIAVMAGWDTDCNAGNAGTIIGVMTGAESFEKKLKDPVNDFHAASGMNGDFNIIDIPTISKYIASLHYILYKKDIPDILKTEKNIKFDFEIPGSTHGMRTNIPNMVKFFNSQERSFSGKRSLKIVINGLTRNQNMDFYYQTLYRRKDFSDERYRPMFSPVAYPGDTLKLAVLTPDISSVMDLRAVLFVKDINGNFYESYNKYELNSESWCETSMVIPDTKGIPVESCGIRIYNSGRDTFMGKIYIDDFEILSSPDFSLDFTHLKEELGSITSFTYNRASWKKTDNKIQGICIEDSYLITGMQKWENYSYKTSVNISYGNDAGIIFRYRGNLINYYFGFSKNKLILEKNNYGKTILCSEDLNPVRGKDYILSIYAYEGKIKCFLDDKIVFDIYDNDYLTSGQIGYRISEGSRVFLGNISFGCLK